LSAINTLIEKYGITADANAGFVLLWASGQQQFAAAEKSGKDEDYLAAVDTLRRALGSAETKTLAGPAARCRYTLGWALFRLDRYEDAAREFTSAFPGLHETQDELAVETAWMAFACYRKLADAEARHVASAADALKRMQQAFPTHPHTQRAAYEMNKLLEKSDPDTMIAQLQAIEPGSENYALARYDLCLLLHRLWTKQRGDPAQSTARLAELRDAADTYLNTVRPADAPRQLQVCLLAADAALHSPTPQLDVAAAMLSRADAVAAQLPPTDSSVIEYHYRLLELATARQDAATRQQQAQWITDNATGSRYEQAGLVIVANALDQQIRAAASDNRATLYAQAYATYSRLVELLGSSPEQMAASKNAQVAASRLAHYALEVGQPAEAASWLDQLLQIQPRDRRYLQRAAQAHLQAGQHAQALVHLRTLLAGLPSGSADWYEAKYYQLEALTRTDVEQARKVYQQLKLLHPDLGGNAWRAKFTQLAASW
jgi:tetratricopeptide (TPR) repeat protein